MSGVRLSWEKVAGVRTSFGSFAFCYLEPIV